MCPRREKFLSVSVVLLWFVNFYNSMDLYVDAGGKVDRYHSQAVAPRPRKRPSTLTLSSIPFIDQYEVPSSARSSSFESSQSMPTWARPLHLVRLLWILHPTGRPDGISSLALPKQVHQFIVPTYIKNLLHLL
jgi:hypothetical protein